MSIDGKTEGSLVPPCRISCSSVRSLSLSLFVGFLLAEKAERVARATDLQTERVGRFERQPVFVFTSARVIGAVNFGLIGRLNGVLSIRLNRPC